jgi:ectoine hydroxylase-related dioxygenase (phytanoyl-CoA dioxygenase family)
MMGATNPASWAACLERDGYCIIPDVVPASVLAALEADLENDFVQTPLGEGDFYGYRTKRFGSLLRRSEHAARLVMEPTVLGLANSILSGACERIQLNVACGIKGQHEYLVNVMWPITRFTKDNGATRIYPGTHRTQINSLDELGEPVIAECAPGSAICFLGSTVHGAGPNRTDDVRRAVVIGYSLGWLKPYENPWLAYPPAIAKTFTPELAALAGYAQHRPNLGNYEGQCPSILLQEHVPAFPRATDALRPDQQEAVHDFARAQRAGM